MKWDEFSDLLAGLAPDTALGRVVQIRAEKDKDVIKHFSPEQKRIRSEWLARKAKAMTKEEMNAVIADFEKMFREMAQTT